MSRTVALGGQRLGSGNKNDVQLHGFERSNHDLSYIWRSSMAPGTLVPFLSVPMLPGDDFDIDLNTMVMTHPTIGPLFGSFKVQLDLFQVPIRLYMGILMQNRTKIGLNMGAVKLPIYTMSAQYTQESTVIPDRDNQQINPSSIFKYLGVSGLGRTVSGATGTVSRSFNAIPWLAYWDIYKQYYANKQEEVGYVIHSGVEPIVTTVTTVATTLPTGTLTVQPGTTVVNMERRTEVNFSYTGGMPKANQLILGSLEGEYLVSDIFRNITGGSGTLRCKGLNLPDSVLLTNSFTYWRYITPADIKDQEPILYQFPLDNIDEIIADCISHQALNSPFTISQSTPAPFGIALESGNGFYAKMSSQEGLGVKTYQSDLFNNWLNTEWIDGTGGVNEISAVSTVGDTFTIDALNLANKVYNLFNRIAVSDGTYKAYIEAAYDHDMYGLAAHPIYEGGLSKELEFDAVVSNAASGENQPLGTLAGKGVMGSKHKGGSASIKANEYSYAMGIISLTPRIDYTQGNAWDINLQSIADFHVPNLDGIGFQDLMEEYMHWQGTEIDGGTIVQDSVGKVPAWINYMTAVNKAYGNFAIKGSEMFMILARNYATFDGISDVTTYIDPVKYNQIFAYTKRDAQNFWVQVRVRIIARRKMSAKVMPNM